MLFRTHCSGHACHHLNNATRNMAIEYISGDFGSKCYPGNPEQHYPSCQGIMCGFGVMTVICYPKAPEAVQSGVEAAPNGFARFFAKMGATTGPIAAQKTM